MTTIEILNANELPHGFIYPRQFMRLIEMGILELEPWYFLNGNQLRDSIAGLEKRYKEKRFVPFAKRQDNDDVACFSSLEPGKVFIVHDFSEPGWEQRGVFNCFYDWLRRAVDDLIEFDC